MDAHLMANPIERFPARRSGRALPASHPGPWQASASITIPDDARGIAGMTLGNRSTGSYMTQAFEAFAKAFVYQEQVLALFAPKHPSSLHFSPWTSRNFNTSLRTHS
jgi:hypothetical protein